jgi:arylsulfatase A-like enzyme
MILPIPKFVTVVLIAASICFIAPAAESQVPAVKPNIIFFISDDMGWGDSPVYNPESKILMPNLDKLAAEGMWFTDAHTPAASCAPTRYSAITGNYHWRGLKQSGQWEYRGGSQILSDQWTIANILQNNGYNTAIFGKLHLGGDFYKKDSDEFIGDQESEDVVDFARGLQNGPLSYGFNYSYLCLRGIQDPPYAFFENDQLVGNPDDLFMWESGWYGDSKIPKAGIGMPYWNSSEVGPILTQKAIEFIDRHHEKNLDTGTNTPFFLYYASQSAHAPFTPPDSFHGEPVRGITGMTPHTDMIYEIDLALGKLMEAVQERGLIDNTLIIFTSDNGGIPDEIDLGHDSVGGLRGRKREIWEGGHRVPFVAKWGDGTPEGSFVSPGTISNQLIGVHDLTVTLAALVGENLPVNQARDSFNFLPVLLGQQNDGNTSVRDHLLMKAAQPARSLASRDGQWKLILDENNDVSGLYDLADDLYETNNLMDDPSQAERIQIMSERLLQLRNSYRTAPVYCDGEPVTILGAEGYDVLSGQAINDIICAGIGDGGNGGGGGSGGCFIAAASHG